MQKSTTGAIAETAGVRKHLADRLAEIGADCAVDALVEAARTARRPGPLAREFGFENAQPAALAMIVARAEDGRTEEALTFTAMAIERRAVPPVHRLLAALEAASSPPEGPMTDAEGRPLVFVVSYPRSGNTRFLNILAGAFPGSRFTALLSEGRYVSPRGPGCAARGPVFVKDHVLREEYRHNPVVYLARDGRDCCLSFNDFKLRKPDVEEATIRRGADSLEVILERGADRFGAWPAHVTAALDWKAAGRNLTIVTYDALMADDGYPVVAGALAVAGVDLSRDRYEAGLRNAADKEEQLRAKAPGWARERIYPQGSMMDRWLDIADASKWRSLLGPEDRARLHAAGFTEPLLRAGFEGDPNWWQSV